MRKACTLTALAEGHSKPQMIRVPYRVLEKMFDISFNLFTLPKPSPKH